MSVTYCSKSVDKCSLQNILEHSARIKSLFKIFGCCDSSIEEASIKWMLSNFGNGGRLHFNYYGSTEYKSKPECGSADCFYRCVECSDTNAANVLKPYISFLCRHNGRGSVSNHQHHDCLLNHVFRRRSKKTSKLRVTGLCVGNSPGTEWPVMQKMFPFDDVIMTRVAMIGQNYRNCWHRSWPSVIIPTTSGILQRTA